MPENEISEYMWKIGSIILLDFLMIILQGLYGVIHFEDSLKNLNDGVHRIYNFFYLNYSQNKKSDIESWYIPQNKNELMFVSMNYPNPYLKKVILLNFHPIPLISLVAVVFPIIRQNKIWINLWESEINTWQNIVLAILA